MAKFKICATPGCGKVANAPNRSNFCCTCLGRQEAEKYPERIAFRNLKKSAKRRRKPFTLTFAEFIEFADRYDYINKRGRHTLGLTVHRKDNRKGYTRENIIALTNSENARIGSRTVVTEPDDNCPF